MDLKIAVPPPQQSVASTDSFLLPMKPHNHGNEHPQPLIKSLVEDAARKNIEILKLRRILGYGEPNYRRPLPPLETPREEYLQMLEASEEDLHLSNDIASIVAETRFPSALCGAVIDFNPERQWRNFDTLQDAAPGILAAIGLRNIWQDWFGGYWFSELETGQISSNPAMLYELFDRGIRSDFLVWAMLDRYFENQQIDFLSLFPPCEDCHLHAQCLLKSKVTEQTFNFFDEAEQRGIPDRPDLIFQKHSDVRSLKQELLENPNASECVRLTLEITQFLTQGSPPLPPDFLEGTYYRQQRERYFHDYQSGKDL